MGGARAARLSSRAPAATPRAALAALLIATLVAAAGLIGAPGARADTDPADPVLVGSQLYLPADAGASAHQRARLRSLLSAARRAGLTVRMAIIPSVYDLGSVPSLWLAPARYARFLGIELAPVHRQPVIVVEPDGVGFGWPGHQAAAASGARVLSRLVVARGAGGLVAAGAAAVQALAAARGVKLEPGSGSGPPWALIAALVAASLLAGIATAVVRGGRKRARPRRPPSARAGALPLRWAVPGVAAVACVAAGVPLLLTGVLRHPASAAVPMSTAGGTPYRWAAGRHPALPFGLTGENGAPVSLATARGRPAIVAFIDPLCRVQCPLAAHVLDQVEQQLPAARRPQIIAVSVDPYGDARASLRADDREWHLSSAWWHWAVGSTARLSAVWSAYGVQVHIAVQRVHGTPVYNVTHDEFAYLIDRGSVRALFAWPYTPADVEAVLRAVASP